MNGHELMGYVTGTGCTATAIIGAFLAVDKDAAEAAATGLAYFGLAGEMAAQKAEGPGGFQVGILDALFTLDGDALRKGVKIQV
jgi:hydroxyethylthiazole kinase